MNRFLLIKASRPYSAGSYQRENKHAIVPPLGLLYLTSSLREAFPSGEIAILDLGLEADGLVEVGRFITQFKPDLIGISAISIEAPTLARVASVGREAAPAAVIVAGGPHSSVSPSAILENTEVDVVVFGEGERTLVELVQALSAGEDPDSVKGIGLLRNGQLHRTPPRPMIENPDLIPLPAWDMVDLQRYSLAWNMQGYLKHSPYASLFTSRGCPYGCTYCHNVFGRGFRPRSAKNVMEEVKLLSDIHGVREFHICDDIFNLDKIRLRKICGSIAEHFPGTALAFPNGVRSDLLDESSLDALVSAGAYSMAFAVETGSPRLQKKIGKRLDIEKTMQAISMADERGVLAHGFFMMGFPTETESELRSTVDVACSSQLLFAHFFTVCPFPGTALFSELEASGMHLRERPENLHYDAPWVNYTNVSDEIFSRIFVDAYRSFYSDEDRVRRISEALSVDMFAELYGKLAAFLPFRDESASRLAEAIVLGGKDRHVSEIITEFFSKMSDSTLSLPVDERKHRVHCFKEQGREIILDGNSGQFFEVDELAWCLVDNWHKRDRSKLETELCATHQPDDVREARLEIEDLIKKGLLFADEPDQPHYAALLPKLRVNDLTLWLTGTCNLACRYCWNDRGRLGSFEPGAFMDSETARLAIELALESTSADERVAGLNRPGSPHADAASEYTENSKIESSITSTDLTVDLYGGEPLLAGDRIWEIVRSARSAASRRNRGIEFEITTNGTLIDKRTAAMLREEDVSVAISMDGPKDVHDRNRVYPDGRGSFADTLRGIECLLTEGVPGLTLRATLAQPFPRIAELVEFLAKLGSPNLEFEFSVPPMRSRRGCARKLQPDGVRGLSRPTALAENEKRPRGNPDLEREARRKLYAEFVRWIEEHDRVIDIRIGNSLFHLMNEPMVDVPCAAGTEMITVTPDGRIFPCVQFAAMNALCMGDVQKGASAGILLGLDQCHPSALEDCSDCWARYICQRVCPAVSMQAAGNLFHQPPSECREYLGTVELSLWALCELKRKAPEKLETLLS